jgi:diguanylate cyclase (GGDEF)-like protein/putative nucleotidyltransferase with HDIG domain
MKNNNSENIYIQNDYQNNNLKLSDEVLLYKKYHDRLTGLKNRLFYEEELQRMDSLEDQSITIVLCDINKFKLVNDVLGSHIGDKLLKSFSIILRRACREKDILARIENDKFAFILTNADENRTVKMIDHIKSQIMNDPFNNLQISITFGFKTKHNNLESINDIFLEAENQLIEAKALEKPGLVKKTVILILKALFEDNNNERKHSKNVGNLCEYIGKSLELGASEIRDLKLAGIMHDIGKITIEPNILHKKGKLNRKEWLIIKSHAEAGYKILDSSSEFSNIAKIVLQHHEKWDGTGYPKGLKAEEILLPARIIAVAEAYDSLTTYKSYKKQLTKAEAFEEIRRCSGTQFDPKIVQVFDENFN